MTIKGSSEKIKRGWGLGLGLFIFSSLIVVFILPLAAIPLGVALIVSGVVAFRQTADSIVHAVAIVAIVVGISIILIVGMLIFLSPTRGSTFSSISTRASPLLTLTSSAASPTSPPTTSQPSRTATPTVTIDILPFQVIYTCDNQLCLANGAGEVEELTEIPSSNIVTDFAVDPRYRWLIYAQQVGETFNENLEWIRLSSDAELLAFTFEAPRAVRSLIWSPSGDRLALVITPLEDETRDVRAGTGLDQLWVLSLEDGQQERIVPQNPGDTVDWRWLHWSQDGRYLFGNRFLPDGSGPPVLYALNLSTYRLQRIGEGKKVLDQNRQGALLLAPLGEGTRGQLWRLDNLTSTRPVSLTPPNQSDWGGRWSPSGDKIIFSSSKNLRGGGSNSLWLMNSDGSNRRQLTEGANDGLACWLPGGEGDYVLFMRDRFELHLLEIETGKTRQILPQANVDYVPVSLHN